MTTSGDEPTVALHWVAHTDRSTLDEVVTLGDSSKATLGMIPRGAFVEFARKRRLLAAVCANSVIGYALFDVARGRVRLIQLCVDSSRRRHGVARLLVEQVSAAHPGLAGISLRCRADYAANTLWPRLGFVPLNEVPGRGQKASTLIIWWRTHGLPHLFNDLADENQLAVAIDHNVFIDLAVSRQRNGALESQALEADWIQSQICLQATPESYVEILKIPDLAERARQRAYLTGYQPLEPAADRRDAAAQKLASALGELPSAKERSDFNHVTWVAAAGVTVFVTRDEDWIKRIADSALESLGVHVMRPSDIVAHLGELQDADSYRPAAMNSTAITVETPRAGALRDAIGLLDQPGGERRREFDSLIHGVVGNPAAAPFVLRDRDDQVLAAWATCRSGEGFLDIPFIRVGDGPLAPTIARQILFRLRSVALSSDLTVIRVLDSHVGKAVRDALRDDGYYGQATGPRLAAVLDVRSTQSARENLPPAHPALSDLSETRSDDLSAEQVQRLELALWPAKLITSSLPAWIVSIQPRWARELFSLQDSLLERPRILGLSREHVYFRSARGGPRAPGRILWYATGSGRDEMRAAVACSHLVEVVHDTSDELFRRFRRFGVYRREDIARASTQGIAQALRFVATEVFPTPVPLERLRALNGDRQPGALMSPTRISNELFGSVYREGTGRAGR